MNPVSFVQAQVWNPADDTWEDITNRIVSINTSTGSDLFEGFWDQPDVGQFSIISRNEDIDPNSNPLIRTNALIYIFSDIQGVEKPLMYGFINDLNVRYIENDFPEITINGTDLIGYLNRIVINQDFIDLFTTSFPDAVIPVELLVAYLTQGLDATIAENFAAAYGTRASYLTVDGEPFENSFGFPAPASPTVKLEIGKTVYELLVGGVSSSMIQIENQNGNLYRLNPYFKDDPSLYITGNTWAPDIRPFSLYYFKSSPTDPWQDFPDLGPEDNTYKFINVNDGFNRIINQVTVSNTNPTDAIVTTFPTVSDDASVTQWGPAKLDLYTTLNPTTNSIWKPTATVAQQAAYLASDIFDYQAIPKMSINSLTVDMNKQYNHDYYPSYPGNGSEFYIQHRVSPNQVIKGYFVVSGVKHSITQNSWFSTFVLRDSEYEIYNANRPKIPAISLSATSGSTATNFTASISNYSGPELANIERIEWMVNLPSFFKPTAPPSQLFNLDRAISSYEDDYDISDVPEFTGSSVTWNYDDGGPLAGYPSAFLGPGFYTVAVWVTDYDGYTACGWTTAESGGVINVASATAHADFFFSKNVSEQVTFYDASGTDTNSWLWDFGDGTTYNGKTPPLKTYATSGTYNVELTVNNGYATDSIIKPVTINVYPLQVQYMRLRFQGTVTRPAGEFYYPVDLIETIGGLQIKNTLDLETGGIQPFYLHARTLDSVQLILESNDMSPLSWVDYGIEGYPPVQAHAYLYGSEFTPIYIDTPGDYYGAGLLNPMSQTMINSPSDLYIPSTIGLNKPKYKFHPVVTNNPDGTQTKTYDFDLTFRYSQQYAFGGPAGVPEASYKRWYDQGPSGAGGTYYLSYNPGGWPAKLRTWTPWGTNSVPVNDPPYGRERYKVEELIVWPGDLELVLEGGPYGPEGETYYIDPVKGQVDYVALVDYYGIQPAHEYLPIEISVSEDGIDFKTVGTAEYSGTGSTLTTTYVTTMPPLNTAPPQV